MTNLHHWADVTDRPAAPGECQGIIMIGRGSYRRYGTA
jgi:hypothetical protein